MNVMIVDSKDEDIKRTAETVQSVYLECNIVVAYKGFEALKFAETGVIDLAIVEIKLANSENGYRVIRAIKDASQHTRVVIYTSSVFCIDNYLGTRMGAEKIFVKSYENYNGNDNKRRKKNS